METSPIASRQPSRTSATGFQTWFPRQPEIIIAADRDRESIEAALGQAVNQAAEVPAARIWIVRMHVTRVEDQLWQVALKPYPDQVDPVIPCSLLLLTPRPAGTEESSRSGNPATCF